METIMMQLGPFQFGLSTAAYQELKRSTEYKWAKQERFGQYAARQFTGPGDDSITLTGVIYPEFRGGTFQLDDMRETAAEGIPQMMVSGRGDIMGLWVIERVEESQTIFADQGVARRQEFSLQLCKYDDATDV